MNIFLLLNIFCLTFFSVNAFSTDISVQLSYKAQTYIITGQVILPKGVEQTVWEVLNDYENIEKIVSSIQQSTVIIKGGEKYIEQRGKMTILAIDISADLLLKVTEKPPVYIEFVDVSNKYFEYYKGSWSIDSKLTATLLSFSLTAKPKNIFMKFLLDIKLSGIIKGQLTDIKREIIWRMKK